MWYGVHIVFGYIADGLDEAVYAEEHVFLTHVEAQESGEKNDEAIWTKSESLLEEYRPINGARKAMKVQGVAGAVSVEFLDCNIRRLAIVDDVQGVSGTGVTQRVSLTPIVFQTKTDFLRYASGGEGGGQIRAKIFQNSNYVLLE